MLNILFISSSRGIDYQCHCLFHGLNELDNVVVYTLNDQPYMYSDYPLEKRKDLYGMGFSIACRISPEKRRLHSKEIALDNIHNHFYDLIIYGEIDRCLDLWDVVKTCYSKNEVVCVEGSDYMHPYLSLKLNLGSKILKYTRYKKAIEVSNWVKRTRETYYECLQHSILFKRELHTNYVGECLPINFAIPKNNIVKEIPNKSRVMAYIVPGKIETYIYKNEEDYYKGYQDSYWGTTFKKAGWDCLRHYEILCNGCIPYFPDIDKCPDSIMVSFPKNVIKYTNKLYEKGITEGSELDYYVRLLLDYTQKNLTTEALANYVLSCVR